MSDDIAAVSTPVLTKPAAKAKKPAKPVEHPAYSVMVSAAVAALKERGGSSRQAILKYVMTNYKVGMEATKINARVKTALKSGVKAGTLKQAKGTGAAGSFRLGEKKLAAEKPKKVQKPKAAAAKKPKSPKKKAAGAKKAAKSPKKAAAKKAAKSPAKKAAAKKTKSPAKKAAAKPKTAKSPAKKASKPAKKAAAKPKVAAAKKPVAKKAAAKK